MDKKVSKPAWQIALWSIVPVAIVCIIVPFIAVTIIGFDWGLVLNVFKVFWLAFLLVIVFVFGLMFLINRYPLGTITTGLLLIAFLFALASPKGNDIAQKLNSAIYDFADVNLLVGAFTISAFALAFVVAYKRGQK